MNAPLRDVLTEADQEVVNAAQPKRKLFDRARSSSKRICSEAPKHISWVVESLFPEDVGLLNATGGTGKTTLNLYFAVMYALEQPILGHVAQVPGKVLIISGEDPEGRIGYRLNKIMDALHLTDDEREQVYGRLEVIDVSDQYCPLARSDAQGNLEVTTVVDDLIEEYKDDNIRWVIFDPLASFSPGDRFVNDGLQLVITACRRLVRHFKCFVQLVHHVNKEVATNKTIGQHSGRGGTALGDGSRFEMQMVQYNGAFTGMPVSMPKDIFARGGSAIALHVHKITDAGKPAKPFCLTRLGFEFTYYPANDQVNVADLERNIKASEKIRQAILAYIRARPDECLSKTILREIGDKIALEAELDVKMPAKDSIASIINSLTDEGLIEVIDLPEGDPRRHGKKKDYLYVRPLKF